MISISDNECDNDLLFFLYRDIQNYNNIINQYSYVTVSGMVKV